MDKVGLNGAQTQFAGGEDYGQLINSSFVAGARIERASTPAPLEEDLGITSIMAARLLYGLLSYVDARDDVPQSPLGNYEEFLNKLPLQLLRLLTPDDVLHVAKRAIEVQSSDICLGFWLMDEANTAQGCTRLMGSSEVGSAANSISKECALFVSQQWFPPSSS